MALNEWHNVLERKSSSNGCNVVCYPIVTRKYHLPYKPTGFNSPTLVDIYDDSARGDKIDARHIRDLLRVVKYYANNRLYHSAFNYPDPPEPSNNNDNPSSNPIKIDSWDGNTVSIEYYDNTKTYWRSRDIDVTYKTTSSGTKFAWDYDYEVPSEHHYSNTYKNPNYFFDDYTSNDDYEDIYVSKVEYNGHTITFDKDDDDDTKKYIHAADIKIRAAKNGPYKLYAKSNQDPDIVHKIKFYVTYKDTSDDDKIKTDTVIKKFKYNPVITNKYIIAATYPDRVKSYLKHLGTLSTINYGDFNSGDLVRSDDFRNLMEAAIEMSRVCHCVSNYTDSSRNICDCNY